METTCVQVNHLLLILLIVHFCSIGVGLTNELEYLCKHVELTEWRVF